MPIKLDTEYMIKEDENVRKSDLKQLSGITRTFFFS